MELRNMEHRRTTGQTPEHWRSNETLADQSGYHGILEHEKSSGTM